MLPLIFGLVAFGKMKMFKEFRNKIERFKQNQKGVTAVYFGLTLPIFLGFAGLAFDASIWFTERRVLQSTVDAATLAATYSHYYDQTSAEMLTAATNSAADNGFTVGGSYTLTINSPPTSGNFANQVGYVQGNMTMPADSFFSGIFGTTATTISTFATAASVVEGEACMVALHESEAKAIDLSGNAFIDMDCGVASRSNNDQAVYINGNLDISADPAISAAGYIYQGGSSTVHEDTDLRAGVTDIKDPYENLTVLTDPAACSVDFNTIGNSLAAAAADAAYSAYVIEETDPNDSSIVTGYTLEPGRYCGDFPIDGETVVMEQGFYILDDADLDINSSQTNLSGDGIAIILTAINDADIGNISIQGGTINLQAHTSGDFDGTNSEAEKAYAGILIYQDRDAIYPTNNNTNVINGNANMILDGGFYIPSQPLDYLGTTGNSSTCTQIIAATIRVSGNTDTVIANTTENCVAMGGKAATLELVLLVE